MWCGCNKNGPRFNHCEPSQLPLGGFVIFTAFLMLLHLRRQLSPAY